jgi:hypothetical protein
MGERFGRLMNYGDGMYAGQFMGAMYAEAFFEKDIVKIIEAGLRAIPAESQYAEMVRDMLKWSKEVLRSGLVDRALRHGHRSWASRGGSRTEERARDASFRSPEPLCLEPDGRDPAGKKTMLRLTVGHHPDGDWDLVVRADERTLLSKTVGKATTGDGWLDVSVDVSKYAGKSVLVELENKPTGWFCEAGYWAKIAIESE